VKIIASIVEVGELAIATFAAPLLKATSTVTTTHKTPNLRTKNQGTRRGTEPIRSAFVDLR
jgi:hypothetical protein